MMSSDSLYGGRQKYTWQIIYIHCPLITQTLINQSKMKSNSIITKYSTTLMFKWWKAVEDKLFLHLSCAAWKISLMCTLPYLYTEEQQVMTCSFPKFSSCSTCITSRTIDRGEVLTLRKRKTDSKTVISPAIGRGAGDKDVHLKEKHSTSIRSMLQSKWTSK